MLGTWNIVVGTLRVPTVPQESIMHRWLAISIILTFVISTAVAEPREEDVAFTSRLDKSEQRYVVIFPTDFKAESSRDLLIALHGHGSDRWQFVRQTRGECKAARDTASKHQMLLASPDYRAKTSWMGPKAEADVVQIIEDLRKKYTIQRVFISGGSMGGTGALTFAARQPTLVHGVVALNGTANLLEYAQFSEAIAESFGGEKSKIPEEYKARSAEYWPERLTMPIAFTTGGKDKAVPPESAIRLHGVLQQLKRPVLLIHRESGGHDTSYEDSMAAFNFAIEKSSAFKR